MSVTDYTFRLLLLFLPGIIAFVIIDNLTVHRETKLQHRAVYSLLLGFLSYLPWMLVSELVQYVYRIELPVQFVVSLTDRNAQINFYEIFLASVFGVVLGCVLCKALNDRWLYHLARAFRISNKFQEIDAWANCIAIYKPTWVRVRDREKKTIYDGRLISTSDPNERDGIVLEEVKVYTENSELLYEVQVIYIPNKMENLTIELI